MNKNIFLILLIYLQSSFLMIGQTDSTKVIFNILYGNEIVDLSKSIFGPIQEDSLVIKKVRFYISDIILLYDTDTVFSNTNNHYLIDAADKASEKIRLEHPKGIKYNKIQYKLGIDSLTNASGILTGSLNPTKGMYWTWQSGYVNFKLEGSSLNCKTKNNQFQFHLGGYLTPHLAIQTIELKCEQSKKIAINLDLKRVIDSIDLKAENEVLSPSLKAVSLSKKIAKEFTISIANK